MATDRNYPFVIEGAKALRAAIEEVFGADQPVQRCRNHKPENVMDDLPKERQSQTRNLMRAAWKVKSAEEGEKRLEQLVRPCCGSPVATMADRGGRGFQL